MGVGLLGVRRGIGGSANGTTIPGARAKARHERVAVRTAHPGCGQPLCAARTLPLTRTNNPFVFLVGGTGPRRCEPLSYQAVVRCFARCLERLGIRTRTLPPNDLIHD
jgi:integrase/recombinase XerD